MEKIRALIADDEQLAREKLKRFLRDETDVELVGEAADGRATLTALETLAPDLLFLDVQMPELNGFEVLESLDRREMPAVIFVTAYDNYALQAFDFHALDYLLKPYNRERFSKSLAQARRQINGRKHGKLDERLEHLLRYIKPAQKSLERIMVKSGGRVFFIRTEEIDWIEAHGNYLRLHVGGEAHLLRETMGRLAAKLDRDKFLRIHRSALVRIESIKELQPLFSGDYTVLLRDNTELTLSRSYRDKLLELFDKSS